MNQGPTSTPDKPVAAFAINLIAGLWMLAMCGMAGWGGHVIYAGVLGIIGGFVAMTWEL